MDIVETLRSIIWGLMLCVLHIIDILWDAAKLICGLDFSNAGFKWIWNWFVYIELFFALFLVLRIIKIVFLVFTDEEFMQKLDPGQWLMKMACAVIAISAVPFVMKQATGFVNNLVSYVEYFMDDTNLQDSQKISTLLVDSSSLNLENEDINGKVKNMKNYILEEAEKTEQATKLSKSEFKKAVKSWNADAVTGYVKSITNTPGSQLSDEQINKVYKAYLKTVNEGIQNTYYDTYWFTGDIDDIDINNGDEEGSLLDYFKDTFTFGLAGAVDKVYYMYPSWSSLFFGLFTVLGVAFLFIPIIIQMAQRIVSMVIKLFLAPYAVSSMIDPGNQTFSTWCKYMISDLISNFFQLYSMMILFAFIGSSSLDQLLKSTTVVGTVAKIAIIIGGLLAVYASPNGVAAIIGGSEMSAANTLNQMQSMLAMGRTATAMALTGTGVGLLAAGAAVGAGGKIAGKVGHGINRLSGGSIGNAMGNLGSKFGFNSGGSDGFGSSADQNQNDMAPNEAQSQYASSLGVDSQGMNRGDLADAVANAGGSLSAFNAMGAGDLPVTGGQLDYASSFGINGSGMSQQELSSAVIDAGGSASTFELLGGKGEMAPTVGQIHYAESLGINNAQNMSRSDLGKEVLRAGGSSVRYNRSGGMSGRDAILAGRASLMNTKNAKGNVSGRSNSIGNFFTSKAASLQNAAKRSRYGYRRW